MSDRETALLDRWTRERPMYGAWGKSVCETLKKVVAKAILPQSLHEFLRMPLSWRLKDDRSLLTKAFFRGKPYTDPYREIEDKIGARVVVLFSEEIRVVETAVCGCNSWRATKARDYEDERSEDPFHFDYQSVHYILRPKEDTTVNGILVEADTPFELQIRTILQHAYSELTHNTIYKPSIKAKPDVKRAAAKSMALIEATDDYFTEVRRKVNLAAAPWVKIEAILESQYWEFIGKKGEPSPLNALLIDHYQSWAKEGFGQDLATFLDEKGFLADSIRSRRDGQILFGQPAVLLVYWVISQARYAAVERSPLSRDELAPLYTDLGIPMPE
jgi:putative GTP pyrophosphokinase